MNAWKAWLSITAVALMAVASPVWSHESSKAWLRLNTAPVGESSSTVRLGGYWEIALRDLDMLVGLDRDLDGQLSVDEFKQQAIAIARLAVRSVRFQSDKGVCQHEIITSGLSRRNSLAYAKLDLAVDCPMSSRQLVVHYRLFQGFDDDHQAILSFRDQTQLLGPGQNSKPLIFSANGTALASVTGFVVGGIQHILAGWDHLAFLLALLIPIGLQTTRASTSALSNHSAGPRPLYKALALTITAFTVAHTVTLGLAVSGTLRLPADPIEAIIAASIIVAAGASLWPRHRRTLPVLAFVFGLVHGFGFANVMIASGADKLPFFVALLGFNLGVEIGQLMFVAAVLPVMWFLSGQSLCRHWLRPALSIVLMCLGFGWFIERVFDLTVLPG